LFLGIMLGNLAGWVTPRAAAAADSGRWLTQTYATDGDCTKGDFAIGGGWHSFEVTSRLIHDHPEGHGWSPHENRTTTICARTGHGFDAEVVGPRRDTNGDWRAPCPTGRWLLTGGFYVGSGVADLVGSHPAAPASWVTTIGGASPDLGGSYALCATVPAGMHTYVRDQAGSANTSATAMCFVGDFALSGGWRGNGIRGSHPADSGTGWTVDLGPDGGSAHAVCVHGGPHSGLSGVYTRNATSHGYTADAACEGRDPLLGAGWSHAQGIDDLRGFAGARLEGAGSSAGWQVETASPGSAKTAWVLCGLLSQPGRGLASLVRALGFGSGLVGLVLLGLAVASRAGWLGSTPRGAMGGGVALLVLGAAVIVAGPRPPAGPPNLQNGHRLAVASRPLPAGLSTTTSSSSTSTTVAASSTSVPTSTTTTSKPGPTTTTRPRATPTTVTSGQYEMGISPAHYSQTCGPNMDLPGQSITLDNTKSSAPAAWSTQAESLGNGAWATVAPPSGTIPAGQTATVTVSPNNPNTCASVPQGQTRDFHVTVAIHWPGASDIQQTVIDSVTGS
jgi:hypothetical protein